MFVGLALEDFLLDRAGCDEAVDETVFLLAVSPDSGEGLLISGGVPVGIEEDKSVGADEIETASSGFTTEEEDELTSFGIIEFVD